MQRQPLGDALLVLRRKFGFSRAALVTGAIGQGCTRCSPIPSNRTSTLSASTSTSQNGAVEPLTDALLILRYLFLFRGSTLITGATGTGCTQCTAPLIEANIAALL